MQTLPPPRFFSPFPPLFFQRFLHSPRHWLGKQCQALLCLLFATGLSSLALNADAQQINALVNGQTLYLPIYSHLYHGDPDRNGKPQEVLTSAHVSIRNTDPKDSLKVLSARYFDTNGRLLKDYVPVAQIIPPLGTLELFVPYADTSGGSGANFLISWSAEAKINPPLIEALHSDVRASRAVVFITTARPLLPR